MCLVGEFFDPTTGALIPKYRDDPSHNDDGGDAKESKGGDSKDAKAGGGAKEGGEGEGGGAKEGGEGGGGGGGGGAYSSVNMLGTTATVVVVTPTHFVVANCGDTRCVLASDGSVFKMSDDHKPNNADEEKRIKAAHGWVVSKRVCGVLSVSRGLGDQVSNSSARRRRRTSCRRRRCGTEPSSSSTPRIVDAFCAQVVVSRSVVFACASSSRVLCCLLVFFSCWEVRVGVCVRGLGRSFPRSHLWTRRVSTHPRSHSHMRARPHITTHQALKMAKDEATGKLKPPNEQMVSSIPDVEIRPRESGDEFLLIACDGVFDVLSNDEACFHVRQKIDGCDKEEESSVKSILEVCARGRIAPRAGRFFHALATAGHVASRRSSDRSSRVFIAVVRSIAPRRARRRLAIAR